MKSTRSKRILQATQLRRRHRIRAKINGTAERPRLTVFRSLKHISAQIINDRDGKTLVAVTDKETKVKGAGKVRAIAVGDLIAKKALEGKIMNVVFDRRGYKYHGQVQALADAARKGGLHF